MITSNRLFFMIWLALVSISAHAALDLEGLVYEAEEWSEPKNAWQKNTPSPNKWNLWTNEENVEAKRSRGASLQSPYVSTDRKTPKDGAPPLHTKITGIPKGLYRAYLGKSNRFLAFSFDGKNWKKSDIGETFLGYFEIKNGFFELWVDDRYTTPNNPGTAYYDYLRFVPLETYPKIYDLKAFTLPNGRTQLSWISSIQLPASKVTFGTNGQPSMTAKETDDNLRNHSVILPPLKKGTKYTATVKTPFHCGKQTVIKSESLEFIAGEHPRLAKSQSLAVPLTIREPTGVPRASWPVVSGVPFAKGMLASEKDVILLDASGHPMPAQFQVTSRWHDGSVRWMTVRFLAQTKAEDITYVLKTGERISDATVLSSSRKMAAKVAALAKYLQMPSASQVLVTLDSGKRLTAKNMVFTPEGSTSFSASGRITCDLVDETGTTVFAFQLNIVYYDILHGMWTADYSLTNVDFRTLSHLIKSIVLQVKTNDVNQIVMCSDGKSYKSGFEVKQLLEKEATFSTESRKDLLEHFDGFTAFGQQDDNLLALQVHDFWQTYPKALSINKKTIRLSLLPELPKHHYPPADLDTDADAFFRHFYWYKNGSYVWKQGMEIQQRITLMMADGKEASMKVIRDWLQQPLFAQASTEHYCKSMAFSNIEPSSSAFFPEYDEAFEESFQQLEESRVKRGEYGWMNYGDWFGERTWNWGNNEYDLVYSLAVQFARTGNLQYLERARQMVRHYATVDILHIPSSMTCREPIYQHCCGHVGDFITSNAPIVKKLGQNAALLMGAHDTAGGHALHVGLYLMANLLGEKKYANVAFACSWNQSKCYTADYRFAIERTVGWCIINNIYAYSMTNNPYFLNACKIFFEAVKKQLNPKTGCYDLPQDPTECDCPDKTKHRGGKPFAMGILMHGLIRLYETTGDKDIKDVLLKNVGWLMDTAWNPKAFGWRYRTGCPKYANGGSYSVLATEGIAYASVLTGNKKYAQFVADTIGRALRRRAGTGPGCGKWFTQCTRQTSHTIYYLYKVLGITSTKMQ